MHRHEIAQGFSEECQARNTDLSGDPFVDRTRRPDLYDFEERHASVLLGEQAKAQAHYQNCAAGG